MNKEIIRTTLIVGITGLYLFNFYLIHYFDNLEVFLINILMWIGIIFIVVLFHFIGDFD